MKVKIEFETGKTTCAIEPGNFCRWLRFKHFGQLPVCHLFDVNLAESEGWLQRCDKCMQLEQIEA